MYVFQSNKNKEKYKIWNFIALTHAFFCPSEEKSKKREVNQNGKQISNVFIENISGYPVADMTIAKWIKIGGLKT